MDHLNSSEENRAMTSSRYISFNFNKDEHLKGIAKIASYIMDTPVSLITLIDEETQWIVTPHGIDLHQMPRQISFCTHAIENEEITLLNDTLLDERFKESPLVVNSPNVRFYAGAVLKSEDGFNIGTLCVFDDKPKQVTEFQIDALKSLSKQVSNIMNLQMSLSIISEKQNAIEKQNAALRKIAFIQSHEVRAPLCKVISIIDMIKMDDDLGQNKYLNLLETSIHELDNKIHQIVANTHTSHD